jgi:hypothetical protein
MQATGQKTAKKFRSIINNHLQNQMKSKSDVESIDSGLIDEEDELHIVN